MAGPPPHGTPLGIWKVVHKIGNFVVFSKENNDSETIVRLTDEEAEYFVVGQSYSFSATQP